MNTNQAKTRAALFEIVRMQFKLAEAVAVSNERLANLEAAALAFMEVPEPQIVAGGKFHKLFQENCANHANEALSLQKDIQEQVKNVLDALEGEIDG